MCPHVFYTVLISAYAGDLSDLKISSSYIVRETCPFSYLWKVALSNRVLGTAGVEVRWKVYSESKVHIRGDLSQQKYTTELVTELTTLHTINEFFASRVYIKIAIIGLYLP